MREAGLIAGVLIVAIAGCSSRPQAAGAERNVLAAYSFGSLSAELPDDITILALRAASEHALRARGYVVFESNGTADSAVVRAKRSGDGLLDGVTVRSRVTGSGSRLSVKVEPFGDEAESRTIMDRVLASIGR